MMDDRKMGDSPLWRALLKSALETEEYEITCEECFDVLDMYADLVIEGTEPAEIMPHVKQHLKHCHCCESELEALMIMLQEAAQQQEPDN